MHYETATRQQKNKQKSESIPFIDNCSGEVSYYQEIKGTIPFIHRFPVQPDIILGRRLVHYTYIGVSLKDIHESGVFPGLWP